MSNRKYEYHWKMVKVQEGRVPTTKISSSQSFYNYIKPKFESLDEFREHFIMVALDRSNHTIGYKVVSSGGIHGTVVDVRIIAKYLTEMMASASILVHNHPSGNLKPSAQDDEIMRNIKKALKLMDVLILDSIIVSPDSFYSYADQGRI